jgi:hypothetical protein
VVIFIIHNDYLRISCGGSRGSVSPDIFRGNLAVSWNEMVLEAGLVIMVGLPDHPLHLRVGISEVPVGVIINIELGLGVFDQSVGIVDA